MSVKYYPNNETENGLSIYDNHEGIKLRLDRPEIDITEELDAMIDALLQAKGSTGQPLDDVLTSVDVALQHTGRRLRTVPK